MIFKLAAEREYLAAIRWYSNILPELGSQFEVAVEAAIAAVAANPQRFPVLSGMTREKIVDDFPYSVIYRFRAGRVTIVAVYHHSRKSFGWRHR